MLLFTLDTLTHDVTLQASMLNKKEKICAHTQSVGHEKNQQHCTCPLPKVQNYFSRRG